jgi:hypothetical protein
MAQATGYNSRTAMISLAPSGVVLAGPVGLDFPMFSASIAEGPKTLTVYTAQLTSSNQYADIQTLRGGMSVVVSHTNTNPNAGTVTPASVTINGGSNSAALSFNPSNTGVTLITVSKPTNFGLSSNKKTVTATVIP